ncbi:hypothetical protein B0H16DRAFT_1414262 [Mycena metata]|uniref:F-box domain-containing protein n=1 Tax=Mycena metata TaxID=1033252 RepID=A0AAD7JGH6_9AGAR|nr:hypothetical protein B0H16DRAFT_1414262 [Mycena metata]
MHRCLGIVEMVHLICTFLLLDSARGTLAALARVCRFFEGPALDVLWSEQDTLRNLLYCMPMDLVKSFEYGMAALQLLRPIVADDWDRVSAYTQRVKHLLSSPGDFHHGPQSDAMGALSASCPEDYFFPNLRTLGWAYDQNFGHIRMLLCPSLERISIVCALHDTENNLSILPTIARKCPALKKFAISVNGNTAGSSRAISSFIRTVPTIENLRIEGAAMLDWTTVFAMADPPALRILDVSALPHIIPAAPPSSTPQFLALQSVSIGSSDVLPATQFLKMFGERPLAKFEVTIRQCVSADQTEAFHIALSAALSHPTLAVLRRATRVNSYLFGNSCIRPLLCFGNLKTVSITSPLGFTIDNSIVAQMAKAWPQIEDLVIESTTRYQRPNLTLECLDAFAQHCSQLRSLRLTLDGVALPSMEAARGYQRRLTSLHVGYSDVSSDTARVSGFLRALFPSLTQIVAATPIITFHDARRLQEMFTMPMRWRAVEYELKGVPVLPSVSPRRGEIPTTRSPAELLRLLQADAE